MRRREPGGLALGQACTGAIARVLLLEGRTCRCGPPPREGSRTVRIRLDSRSRVLVAVIAATLVTALPAGVAHAADAGFTWSPTSPQVGSAVSFAATQQPSPAPPQAATWAWDFESDGAIDSTAPSPQHTFPTAGTWNVTLTVVDLAGPATQTRQVEATPVPTVPESSFSHETAGGAAPLTIQFVDGSSNAPTSWSWTFGDGEGSTLQSPSHAFARPGTYTVALVASNAAGTDATPAVGTITVSAAGPSGPAMAHSPTSPVGPSSLPRAPAVLMSPFPTVRLRGTVRAGWSRIDLLAIRAPRGSIVRVRCQGAGCPYAARHTGVLATTRTVRFTSMQRRLRAGALVRISITASGSARLIGKYTSFMMRRGTSPLRRDRCIAPGASRPTPCPPARTSSSDLLMSPFPVVRLRGAARRGWSRVTLLTVRASGNSEIRARCDGAGCPYASKRLLLTRARTVRFRALERRFGVGTVIRLSVTTPEGRIGKYTSFVMRRAATPLRRDRCLAPGATTPMRCPS